MDEKKAYGLLLALGKSVGEDAQERPEIIPELRAIATVDALEAFLVAHRGNVPEAMAREFARSVAPEALVPTRAKLVIQAKMVAAGQDPVSPADAAKGPVKHR